MEEDLKEYLCLGFAGDLKVLLVRSAQPYRGGAFLKAGGETQVSGCPGVGAVPALVAGLSCRCKEKEATSAKSSTVHHLVHLCTSSEPGLTVPALVLMLFGQSLCLKLGFMF